MRKKGVIMQGFNHWQCRSCGHEVFSERTPDPIKWTDGHVCYFTTKSLDWQEVANSDQSIFLWKSYEHKGMLRCRCLLMPGKGRVFKEGMKLKILKENGRWGINNASTESVEGIILYRYITINDFWKNYHARVLIPSLKKVVSIRT